MSDTVTALIVADETITEIFRSLAGIITALVAVLAWWSSRKAAKSAAVAATTTVATSVKADTIIKKAEETDVKANTLIEETAKIHTLTNSTLSTTTSALAVANTQIEGFIKAQQIADKKIEDLQSLVHTLVEQERGVAQQVKETNGMLRKSDSGPLPVQDDQLAAKIDGIVTPKLDAIKDTVDKKE